MTTVTNSPPNSSPSSPGSHGTKTPLSLDLSAVPPLINPSPPSNTLLITNLQDPSIFHPTHLLTIRTLINQSAPLHSFAPLKSLRRIIASFHTTPDAILIRRLLDNAPILSSRMRIYFGEPTPIDPTDQHLHAPKSSKLFFISPPPSPPHGWQMRNEEPPNKDMPEDRVAGVLTRFPHKRGVVKARRETFFGMHGMITGTQEW
ncbi:Calcipressin [Lasallia pustulata]|uniref:Calcipressin n=1 Tax=Lasallia pustulata TaxID=136370 RepID=A0A1W5CYE3_9LECA|nr:Calcipressin [Lasallia pustulata]